MYVAQTSFAAGELSTRTHARVDVETISQSARALTNVELGRLGSAVRRRGWAKVGAAAHASSALLVPMRLRGQGEFLLEFATDDIHIHASGSASVSATIASPPWSESELKELQYAQYGELLFLAHHDHEPRVIEKIGATWTLKKADHRFSGPAIDPKRKKVPLLFVFKAAGAAGKEFVDAAEDTFRNTDVDTAAFGTVWRFGKYWMSATKFLNARRLDVTLLGGVASSEKKELLDTAVFDWAGPWKAESAFELDVTIDANTSVGEKVRLDISGSFSGWDDRRRGSLLSLFGAGGHTNGEVLIHIHNHMTHLGNDYLEGTLVHCSGPSTLAGSTVYTDCQFYTLQDRHTQGQGISLQSEPIGSDGTNLVITASPYPGTTNFPTVFDNTTDLHLSDSTHAASLIFMNGGAYRIVSIESDHQATVDAVSEYRPSHQFATTDWSFGWSRYSGYPRTVAVHQRRLVYGGVDQFPHRVFLSETENPYNFGSSVLASSPLTLSITAETGGGVNWMRSAGSALLVGTEDQEVAIGGLPLSPAEVGVDVQTGWGSRNRMAVMAGPQTCFVSRDGRGVRGMSFRFETERWESPELNELSEHLFEGSRVKQLAYSGSPESRLYVLREDGTVCCLTTRQDTSVRGWSQWTTAGGDSIICIAVRRPQGDGEDELWAITSRGGTRYLEKIATGTVLDHQIEWTSVTPNTSVTGLASLNGRSVQAVSGSGTYLGTFTVSGGAVTVSPAQTAVSVGLPFTYTVTPYRPEATDRVVGDTVGRVRRYTGTRVQLKASKGESTAGGGELLSATDSAVTGWRDVMAVAQAGDDGDADLTIVQNRPFAFEVMAVSTGVHFGGS